MSTFLQPETREQILGAIAGHAGLHFPPERWPDVERGLEAVAEELGIATVDKVILKILQRQPEPHLMELIARHLTVGETYFMRDPATFEVLRQEILGPLIQERRASGERHLRIWSAGCCTGEEVLSLAILVAELLPDLHDWQVTILGTDINRTFLKTAEAGIYKKWSFRGLTGEFQRLHFTALPDGRHAILPQYRQMAAYRYLNLAEDNYPSFSTDTESMDVIFCRNVLIYFSPEQCLRTGRRLLASLAPGGWLVASAAEPSTIFAPLVPITFPGVIMYRKLPEPPLLSAPPVEEAALPPRPPAETPPSHVAAPAQQGEEELVEHCRARANAGDLEEALRLCDLALLRNRLDPRLHYLRGSILQEAERLEEASRSFRRAVHLDHCFVPAYFALGTLAGKKGRRVEQIRHFEGALEILRASPPDEIVPESSGMTAARLAEVIETSMQSPT